MKTNKLILILFLIITSSSNLYTQSSSKLKIDTILVNGNRPKNCIVSNLALLSSSLDSNIETAFYWYENFEKYDYDHTGIFKKLNKKLSTKTFSDVFAITFFCINSKNEKNYSWIRVEEWHFSNASKALEAVKSLGKIKQSGINYLQPIHWLFIPYKSKIYFLSSEYFSIRSSEMEYLKNTLLKTLSIDESSVIEYGTY